MNTVCSRSFRIPVSANTSSSFAPARTSLPLERLDLHPTLFGVGTEDIASGVQQVLLLLRGEEGEEVGGRCDLAEQFGGVEQALTELVLICNRFLGTTGALRRSGHGRPGYAPGCATPARFEPRWSPPAPVGPVSDLCEDGDHGGHVQLRRGPANGNSTDRTFPEGSRRSASGCSPEGMGSGFREGVRRVRESRPTRSSRDWPTASTTPGYDRSSGPTSRRASRLRHQCSGLQLDSACPVPQGETQGSRSRARYVTVERCRATVRRQESATDAAQHQPATPGHRPDGPQR